MFPRPRGRVGASEYTTSDVFPNSLPWLFEGGGPDTLPWAAEHFDKPVAA
jgi:hypothetical protein